MKSTDPSETFRNEVQELLETLEQTLLDLEQNPNNRDLIDSAFRALHTIKGSGAMFGFDHVAEFVHQFETAFDRVRKGAAKPTQALIAIALRARDHIAKLVTSPTGSRVDGGDEILAGLRSVVETSGEAQPAEQREAPDRQEAARTYRVRFRLPSDALATGANPFLMLDELRGLGECSVLADVAGIPSLNEMDPEGCYLAWDLVLTTSAGTGAIEDVFMFLADGMELKIQPVEDSAAAQTGKAPAASDAVPSRAVAADLQHAKTEAVADKPAAEKSNVSLRVPAERLDELMARVGELVIAQARLSQIAGASSDANLKNIAEELERLSSGLRDTTMGIRMVPIGTLFGRFRRLIHDLSRDLGKEIEFVTSGEETELDKTVIERLADPLVHLIRNSIDHGIEDPAVRVANGKPAKGTVRLSAVHAGAEVSIMITDDGAGLNVNRIRAKAEEAGLLGADARLTDAELFQFIFHPGFSTAKEVTSVSGRGVGMDVVKRTIEGLRGNVELRSTVGQSTTASLRLPLTLAIIESMLVRVGKGRYAIPLSAVEECVELSKDVDQRGGGRNFLNIRGDLVPFLRLRELFKVDLPPDPHQKVVIVSAGDLRVGLVVDQIIGNNQTVIKSLSKLHANIETFSGATILGDGAVALILDVAHLVAFGQAYEQRMRAGRAA